MADQLPVLQHATKQNMQLVALGHIVSPLDGDLSHISCYMTLTYKPDTGRLGIIAKFTIDHCTQETTRLVPLTELLSKDLLQDISRFSIYSLGPHIHRLSRQLLFGHLMDRLERIQQEKGSSHLIKVMKTIHPAYMSYPGSPFPAFLESVMEEEAKQRYITQCAKRIQQSWRHAIASPYHTIGRNRLLREFTELAM